MANYIVAVSGGVDSVALLDMLSRSEHRLIVAHVDHGIREDAAADARFVAELAKRYHLPFVSTELQLGAKASEELARDRRYRFLFELADEHQATVVTAHHLDDVVETVALNLERGTGWRGLAVLARPTIIRPLLNLTKQQIYAYVLKHRLEWVEDSTNASDVYQRNRLRHKIAASLGDSERRQIMQLRTTQLALRRDVERETMQVSIRHYSSRHFLTHIDEAVAIELLGYEIQQVAGTRPPRPRLSRALLAIKTARAGTVHQVGEGVQLAFTARKYHVSVV